MQENREHTHKKSDTTQPPKASIAMYYSTKHHCNTTMETFKAIATTKKFM